MSDKVWSREQILALLAETPSCLAALSAGLEPAQLHRARDSNEWSINDVLAHLRSCADVWGGCIATILAEDRPTIRAIDPRTWITQTVYPGLDFRTSFESFTAQRTDLLAVLESLPPDAWSRSATVTGAGKPLERTVHSYAQRLARHERTHVRQIERIATALVAVQQPANRQTTPRV